MLKKENMLLSNVQTQPIKPAGRTKGSNAISKADGNTSGGGGVVGRAVPSSGKRK